MIIPASDADKLDFYNEIITACRSSRQDRISRYAQNRRWYLYGTDQGEVSPWNKIYSHLDLVTSFLYASDSTKFSVNTGYKAPEADRGRARIFSKCINKEWKLSNADIVYQQAILWALVFDSTFVKHIRRAGEIHPFLVDPGSMGVYREDTPMLDRQEAFVHWYYMTTSDLERRLHLHPKREEILKNVIAAQSKQDIASNMPPLIDRVITSAVTPDLIGQANINLSIAPEYQAALAVDLVEMSELYVWNDEIEDYQVVTMASDQAIVYDRQNFFIPRSKDFEPEHGFVQICPNPLYDYFWGSSEVDQLIPIQSRRNERMDDIQRLLAKQVDPPSGWAGQGITDEKLNAFNSPGANFATQDPMLKRETFIPVIPADVYADIKQLDAEFDERSGVTNTLSGRGESGVRSDRHANKLATLGSSRPKKRALIIEDSLEKGAGLYGKVLYSDDDTTLVDEKGQKFILAQMSPDFEVEVDAHSNSPIFMENQRETAAFLFKAKAIDRARLIEMVAPPMQEELLRDLREKIIPGEAAQAKQRMEMEAQRAAGKPGLSAVK